MLLSSERRGIPLRGSPDEFKTCRVASLALKFYQFVNDPTCLESVPPINGSRTLLVRYTLGCQPLCMR